LLEKIATNADDAESGDNSSAEAIKELGWYK
jgi:hypothetical protein